MGKAKVAGALSSLLKETKNKAGESASSPLDYDELVKLHRDAVSNGNDKDVKKYFQQLTSKYGDPTWHKQPTEVDRYDGYFAWDRSNNEIEKPVGALRKFSGPDDVEDRMLESVNKDLQDRYLSGHHGDSYVEQWRRDAGLDGPDGENLLNLNEVPFITKYAEQTPVGPGFLSKYKQLSVPLESMPDDELADIFRKYGLNWNTLQGRFGKKDFLLESENYDPNDLSEALLSIRPRDNRYFAESLKRDALEENIPSSIDEVLDGSDHELKAFALKGWLDSNKVPYYHQAAGESGSHYFDIDPPHVIEGDLDSNDPDWLPSIKVRFANHDRTSSRHDSPDFNVNDEAGHDIRAVLDYLSNPQNRFLK